MAPTVAALELFEHSVDEKDAYGSVAARGDKRTIVVSVPDDQRVTNGSVAPCCD
jgi:hypothetical protein